jgi:hypothetical protein
MFPASKLRMMPGRIAAPGFFPARKQRAWSIDSFASQGARMPTAVHFGETNPRCKNATVADRSSRVHVTADNG